MVRVSKSKAKQIGKAIGKRASDKVGPLSKEQKLNFQKAKKNYNARIARQVKKWQKQFPDMDAETIMRTGIVPWKMTKQVSEIKTKDEYKTLMQLMRHQKTKTFKKQTLKETRDTLKQVLDYAYFPDPAATKEMKSIIDKMSADEIIQFRLSNKELVKNFFLTYDIEYNGVEGNLPEDREVGLGKVMNALRKYKKGKA